MDSGPAPRGWRAVALIGATLAVFPMVFYEIDIASHFRFEWIDDYFGEISALIPLGVILCFIGAIMWAKRVNRSRASSLGFGAFVYAWGVILIGYLVDGMNVHGSAGIAMFVFLPMVLLALILWTMAALKPRMS
ncbi:MAG TPA: hypothetical protein VG714_10885 [Acidobacteriaceae bacterium]|nr:hypothetical protein [Acidobacteriaceae bacterium]